MVVDILKATATHLHVDIINFELAGWILVIFIVEECAPVNPTTYIEKDSQINLNRVGS